MITRIAYQSISVEDTSMGETLSSDDFRNGTKLDGSALVINRQPEEGKYFKAHMTG